MIIAKLCDAQIATPLGCDISCARTWNGDSCFCDVCAETDQPPPLIPGKTFEIAKMLHRGTLEFSQSRIERQYVSVRVVAK